MSDFYEELSKERKLEQDKGYYPDWFITGGYSLFKEKYLFGDTGFKGQAERIAKTLSKHLGKYQDEYEKKFFDIIWNGDFSCSTPLLGNTGTPKGMPVSCEGGYVRNAVGGFYEALTEQAILSKYGHGGSVYVGDVSPRGSKAKRGGKTSGVWPVIEDMATMSQKVSQGNARRGQIASYLSIEHGDFWEVARQLEHHPDGLNIGWNIHDTFIQKLKNNDAEAKKRFAYVLKVKMQTGRGYFAFIDKINRHSPQMYKDLKLAVKASNLCVEVTLFSDDKHTFSCVLGSMNLYRWEHWKNTDAVFTATVLLDCVVSEYLYQISLLKPTEQKWFENIKRFTEKGRALGLGACGLHSLYQSKSIPFGSFEAYNLNRLIFKHIRSEADRATRWLAKEFGEPEWCKGYGVRNTHVMSIAPTKSTALIMGGVSEGINPDAAMVYTFSGAGGEVTRINPQLLSLMKEKGVYTKKNIQEVVESKGSVQNVSWLSDEEKEVYRTAFEIDQMDIIRQAEHRGEYIDQWQSLNLFLSAEEDEEYIAKLHQYCFLSEKIRGLYYCYSLNGVKAAKNECAACQ